MKITFLEYLYELFNTKTYEWVSKDDNMSIAKFIKNDFEYFIEFQSRGLNVYSIVFYYTENQKRIYNLTNLNGTSASAILSNVLHATLEHFKLYNPNMYCFSTDEKDRLNLYTIFSNTFNKFGYNNITKKKNNKIFFFIYTNEEDFIPMINFYINSFIKDSISNNNPKTK